MDQAIVASTPLRSNPLSHLNITEHPELAHIMTSTESFAQFRALHPEEIIIRWVNYQIAQSGSSRTITNLTTDLRDSTIYAELLSHLTSTSNLLDKVLGSFSPSGYWRSNFERRAGAILDFVKEKLEGTPPILVKDIVGGAPRKNALFLAHLMLARPTLPPATPEQLAAMQRAREEEERERARLEMERLKAEGKLPASGAPVGAPASAAEAKLQLWEGDDEEAPKKDDKPPTPEEEARKAEEKRKIEEYKQWVRSLGLDEAYMTALLSKSPSIAMQFDRELAFMQLAFKYSDTDALRRSLEKAESLLELNIDWERRNKLKVYTATYAMMVRDFPRASKNFLECLATFTSTELFSFEQFIFYTVAMALFSEPRQVITEKVINAPEILSVLHAIPHLHSFMHSLYHCRYRDFFVALGDITARMQGDKYLAQHVSYYGKEMRVIAYRQYIQPYRSVTFDAMAAQFGVDHQFLENELERFIYAGKLSAKIDKKNCIVEAYRADSKNLLLQNLMRQGDGLMNRIQKLASTL
ncbi:putative 26S proteasome non-ATPase regulatory subunit 6 [Paratrimastix pyriformis]|uniref:26S proteasome non-ATPase regulatory subunit 6 n=1 Tax=Paratrimastix pyriformis TaxID=342808 RepID=A0ABQ8UVM7_9EUKA|nr:putative 26S proteasome non-ATPase regulatory subunit 6 [Paratrimastix pyriformis]